MALIVAAIAVVTCWLTGVDQQTTVEVSASAVATFVMTFLLVAATETVVRRVTSGRSAVVYLVSADRAERAWIQLSRRLAYGGAVVGLATFVGYNGASIGAQYLPGVASERSAVVETVGRVSMDRSPCDLFARIRFEGTDTRTLCVDHIGTARMVRDAASWQPTDVHMTVASTVLGTRAERIRIAQP